MQDIRTVFNILGKNNIKVSVFTVNLQTLDFLGYNISADGVKPTKKINNLQSFPTPVMLKNLRSFLGTINFIAN